MVLNAVAFFWRFAEATLFLIVPDVWLSGIALCNFAKALRASAFALAGAVLWVS